MFIRKHALERIAKERRLYRRHPGGDLLVCLVYPNVYRLGMANLGFQAVYHILESDSQVAADRAFLPDPDELEVIREGRQPLVSFEGGRPLGDFDVLAFSISFETDYLNVLAILEMAGIPARSRARADANYPLVIAGGSAIFLNPEPIADFIDLFLIGEGEEVLPEFLSRYRQMCRGPEARLDELERVEGAYVPGLFTPAYDQSGRIAAVSHSGPGAAKVSRRLVRDVNRFSTTSLILSDESVFGDMYLVEASRGCQWGCRFCAAGFMYRPIRYRDPQGLLAEAVRGLDERGVIGLVGAEMGSVPGVAQLAAAVAEMGGRLSPSSLKADSITPALSAALGRNGNLTVTIAPEAGSERMRKVINKNLSEPEILRAAELLTDSGIQNLKLYFMIGLPEERDDDVREIARLTGKIAEACRAPGKALGRIRVSLNPFVPKPWTPFQWDPMEGLPSLRRKLAILRAELGRIGRVELDAVSLRQAYVQALVSRGDRRVGGILERLNAGRCESPGQIWCELAAIKRGGAGAPSGLPNPDFYVTRAFGHDEILPWDFIDHHVLKRFLLSERKRAHYERETRPCDVSRCKVCGAC